MDTIKNHIRKMMALWAVSQASNFDPKVVTKVVMLMWSEVVKMASEVGVQVETDPDTMRHDIMAMEAELKTPYDSIVPAMREEEDYRPGIYL